MMRGGMMLSLAALLLQTGGALAATLDKDSCARLEEEQGRLEQAGVRATLEKGPAWGKANLPAEKLEEVRRLIEVDEQLIFRCQGKPLVLLPSAVDAEPVDPANAEKDADGKPAAARAAPEKDAAAKDGKVPQAKKAAAPAGDAKAGSPTRKPPTAAAKAAAAKGQADAKQAKDGAAAESKAAKPKAVPKKKVDDAYKPPIVKPDADPFAGQDAAKQ